MSPRELYRTRNVQHDEVEHTDTPHRSGRDNQAEAEVAEQGAASTERVVGTEGCSGDACHATQSNTEEPRTMGERLGYPFQGAVPDNVAVLVRGQELGPQQTLTHINRSMPGRTIFSMSQSLMFSQTGILHF